jgi:hypothetical protein
MTTSKPAWGEPVHELVHDKLLAAGFIPSSPVYESKQELRVRDLRRALFKSRYESPILLTFKADDDGVAVIFHMVVESVGVLWDPFVVRPGDQPVGCWPVPDYYVTGTLFTSVGDSVTDRVPMRAYIGDIDQSAPEIYFQVDRLTEDVREGTPLRMGVGHPGHPAP